MRLIPLYIVGVFGLCFGSFINVVIYRLPRGQSILSPGSRCPSCDTALRWYDMVPVASFLWLRGRCRYCRLRIPWYYPVVEAIVGAGSIWVYAVFCQHSAGAMPWTAIRGIALLGLLVAAAFIDIFHRKIPNKLILYGLSAAVALEAVQLFVTYVTTLATHSSVISGVGESVSTERTFFGSFVPAEAARTFIRYCGETFTRPAWTRILISQGTLNRVGGFFLLGGAMFAIAMAARGGMGGGDVKLASVIGVYAGIIKGVTGLLLAFIGGAVAGLILIIFKKAGAKTAIPFAPFLALGGFAGFMYGDTLFLWYLSTM